MAKEHLYWCVLPFSHFLRSNEGEATATRADRFLLRCPQLAGTARTRLSRLVPSPQETSSGSPKAA